MRLVDQDQHLLAIVDLPEYLEFRRDAKTLPAFQLLLGRDPELMNHHEVEIRRVSAKLLQLGLGLNHRHALAGQHCIVLDLLLEFVPVHYDHDLPSGEIKGVAHLPDKKHHRQRLAATLRMPDDTAPPLEVPALAKPLDHLADRAILVVAANDLDEIPALGGEQRKVLQNVEQDLLVEHSADHHFLTNAAVLRLDRAVFLREDVRPVVVIIELARNGPEPRLGAVGNDIEEVRMEKRLLALVLRVAVVGILPLVGIAPNLLPSIAQRLGDIEILALNHDPRQSVHDTHDVRHNVRLRHRGRIDAELVDRQEPVVIEMSRAEIHEFQGWILLARHLVLARERQTLPHPVEHLTVGLHKRSRLRGDLVIRPVKLLVRCPRIDLADPFLEMRPNRHFPEAHSPRDRRIRRVLRAAAMVDDLPPNLLQLLEKRPLDI